MTTKKDLLRDRTGAPIQIMDLSASHDVDGTSATTQSDAIEGEIVRICAIDNDIRFSIGTDPEAEADSLFLSLGSEIWMPIKPGDKVAVLGGKANIATAGIPE